jgi:hypothetical protein
MALFHTSTSSQSFSFILSNYCRTKRPARSFVLHEASKACQACMIGLWRTSGIGARNNTRYRDTFPLTRHTRGHTIIRDIINEVSMHEVQMN